MTRLRTLLSRLADVLFRRSREDRLDAEVEHHMAMLADELQASGWPRDDARLEARRRFGGVDRVRMLHREQRGWPGFDALVQDVRFAVRVLMRDWGFALTAVLVLGAGIGVNNLFFTLVYAHKFRGVPVADVQRVLFISTFDDRANSRLVSIPEFDDLRAAQTSFSDVAAYVNGVATIGDDGRAPERFNATYLTANALPLLGLSPIMGRLPSADDDRPGGALIVMLGRDVWQTRYAGDPQILGRTVIINGAPATVIGIIAESSGFPSTAGIWLPLGQFPEWKADRSARPLLVIGRLKDEVSEQTARSEVETIFGRFETAHADSNRNVRARVVTLNERLLGTLDGWEPFIMAGIIVILVACANVGNLMMARAVNRAPEVAIRTSLGASRIRIVCQLLVEAGLIAGAGAAVGLVISVAGVHAVQAGIPDGILPYWFDYAMDRGVFTALVGLSLATIAVFGLVPALHASRTDVNRTLKDGGRHNTGRPGMRLWTAAFLTAELALAMTLLNQVAIASYLANRSIPTDAHINTTEVMTTAVTLPARPFVTAESRLDYFSRLEARLRQRAEVVATSRVTMLPGEGVSGARRLRIRGQEPPPAAAEPSVLTIDVAPGYFDTLALGLVKGRDFNDIDGSPTSPVAIVNDRFAQVYLSGAEPIGTQIAVTPGNAPLSGEPQWLTVVGVAPTIRQQSAGGVEQQSPVVYVPIAAAAPATSTLMVRHRVSPEAAAEVLRTEAQANDPNVALYRMRTLAQAVKDGQWNRHTSAVLANTVSSLSVLLAMIGLYAVTAQRVTLRTREIGLRMALGARPFQVARVIIAGLRVPLLLGLLLGTAGAMAWDGMFATGVAELFASAPLTLLKIAACIAAFVAVSCAIPLRRAIAANPVAALRE